MRKLVKVTTAFQNTWLIKLKNDPFSEKNTILFGDTLRLSIAKNDIAKYVRSTTTEKTENDLKTNNSL